MEKNMVRLLRANEIECRVATINEKGLSLLLYKDARVDQRILDETFGPFGWKRSHQCIDGKLYCTVEIFDKGNGSWVAKQDVGAAGFAEKEKSQASDSFKRACFNWGIGRELYTAPFIWIPASKTSIYNKNDRFYSNDRFSVQDIDYSKDREITHLVIINDKGNMVYELKEKATKPESEKESSISTKQIAALRAEMERTGVGVEAVNKRYGIKEPEAMSQELYNKVMKALAKTKTVKVA